MDLESKDKAEETYEKAQSANEEIKDRQNEEVVDSEMKKEPITILSVEVMSSAAKVPHAIEHVENDMDTTVPEIEANINIGTHSNQKCDDTKNLLNMAEVKDNQAKENSNTKSGENTSLPRAVEETNQSNVERETNSKEHECKEDKIKNLDTLDTQIPDTLLIDPVLKEHDVAKVTCTVPIAESTYISNESSTSITENLPSQIISDNDANCSSPIPTENLETNTTTQSTTGLSLLAQYGSDNESDTESVIEVPMSSNQDYRNKVVEIDSDSDSGSSSSDSDVEYLENLRKKIEKRMEVDDDDDEDDDDEEGNKSGNRKKPKTKVKAKGELLLEDLPPIQDLQITVPEDECIELGKIHSIVDQLVLVSALPNSVLLDLETVLFLEKGQKVLGEVFDVLGQVADPLYCVRFNSHKQINEKNIKINDIVYVAPKTQYTQFIILSSIMNLKGSDASWENDVEPPPRFLDYSDDEQEQLARRQLRNRNRPTENDEDAEKRPRIESEGPRSSGVRTQNTQNTNRYQNPRPGGEVSNINQRSYSRTRPSYNQNPQYHNQHSPINHHPSSWHSNYYPQAYPVPATNYGYANYPPMPGQNYQQVPIYPMQPMHSMAYPPPHHIRSPQNNVPVQAQMHPSVFSIRPPTIPGGFDSSPPPPGSQ